MPYESKPQSDEINLRLIDMINTKGMEKEASDTLTEFTRTTLRERSYHDEVMPPLKLEASDFDRNPNDDAPIHVVDVEPESPSAVSVGFGAAPQRAWTLASKRYAIGLSRILSPRMQRDHINLLTYKMDIRQVVTDNMLKDMLAEKDTRIQDTYDVYVGDPNTAAPMTGEIQNVNINGGITRSSLLNGFKTMSSLPTRLRPATCVASTPTMLDIEKMGFDEAGGGEFSAKMLINGFASAEFLNRRWVFTIKEDLVPGGRVDHYADPMFIGKNVYYEEPQMFVERRFYMLEFFCYSTLGYGIGNGYGFTRANYV